MAITDRRIQSSKQRVLRAIMRNVTKDVAAKQSIGEFVKGVIAGDLAKAIAIACKPIQPVSRVEVRKSEVWIAGEAPPAPEVPAAEVEAEVVAEAPEAGGEEPAAEPEPVAPAPAERAPEELPPEDEEGL